MPRWLSLVLFLAIALTITGAAHYYIWARLVRDLHLPPPWHGALTGTLVALWALMPLSMFVARRLPRELTSWVVLPAFIWMGVAFLTLSVLLATEAGTLLWRLGRLALYDGPPPDPERRVTLQRLLGGGVWLVVGTAGAAALRSGLGEVAVKRVEVALARLPKSLDGTTIVQLSDVHVGPTIGRRFIERIVQRVNALEPDVIAITGDLVDGSVNQLREHVEPLARLRAKHGVYFVTGNHEYYSGVEPWCAELRRLGIHVLRNERVSIGDGDDSFDLAGVDDYNARRFGGGHGPNLAKAVSGRDPSRELVLLAHQPREVFEARRHGVGLQLSGHTHGGQMFPWNYLVRLQQPVVSGLERVGDVLVYVSNGTGYWGPPMRLGAPAEVTRITLRAS